MPNWFWISFALISALSIGALIVFYREIAHVCRGEIQILGEENAEHVYTLRFKILRIFYVGVVLLLIPMTGLLYWMYL